MDELLQDAIEVSATHRAAQEAVVAASYTPPFEFAPPIEAAFPPGGPGQTANPEAAYDGPLLTEEFVEVDVREAVGVLASEAGADVLMDDKVRGVVNVTIEEASFDEALDKVLLPLGFVVGKRGNQYVVSPPDPASPLYPFVSTHVEYKPQHLTAKSLLAAPPAQMLKFVRVVDETNTLVIEAPTQYIELILQRLRQLDQPVPQVELEAIVCVVSPDSGFRFGLDWGHAVELDGEKVLDFGSRGLALSGAVSPYGAKNAFSDFATTSAFVKLLAENGYLTIRASPRVVAEQGKKAEINIGRQTYFAIQPPGATGDNSAFFFQQDIQTVESGIKLEITPHVRGDIVTVEIEKAEVSEDIRSAAAELALNPYPIINRRSVSTTVHVEDGRTVVIGGLVQREAVDRMNRVPGLSTLPGLGYFFKSVERQAREAEIAIFIAPRIVRPTLDDSACTPLAGPPPETYSDELPLQQPAEVLAAP